MPKVVIGFITYSNLTAKYLPEFLASLRQQTFTDYQILAIDNTPQAEANPNQEFISKHYPEINLIAVGVNLGFAKAYNRLIIEAIKLGTKYFLIINPDTVLEPLALEKLVGSLEANAGIGAAGPKTRRWDFINQRRTTMIDSCGLVEQSALRFIDLGAGQPDRGQFDYQSILAPSGAAGLWRLDALQDIRIKNQYFDERFFLYKEDCDLAKRLQLAGWQAVVVPSAVVYHARTARADGKSWLDKLRYRAAKTSQVNYLSFIGQEILFYKYRPWQNGWQRLSIGAYRLVSLVYALLFEKWLLAAYREAKALRPGLQAESSLIRVKK